MSQLQARVRLYVTRGNRRDFYAEMAPARDDAKDSFTFMGVKFSFGERNTVYTEVDLDDETPPPITEGFCRVLRIVITTDDAPPLGAAQAGRYNARVLNCEGTSAVAMMNEVKGVSVTGTNLRNVRRAFRRIMQGSVRPSAPAG